MKFLFFSAAALSCIIWHWVLYCALYCIFYLCKAQCSISTKLALTFCLYHHWLSLCLLICFLMKVPKCKSTNSPPTTQHHTHLNRKKKLIAWHSFFSIEIPDIPTIYTLPILNETVISQNGNAHNNGIKRRLLKS